MARCSKACWCRCLRSELHYSRFCFCYPDWRAFTYSPWLPQKWQWQWMFLVYRWIVALYFLSWLIVAGIECGRWFLIFLTNWCLMVWTNYLLVSASSATFKYIKVNFFDSKTSVAKSECETFTSKPAGCCGTENNGITWYQQYHWLTFNIGAEAALLVLVLYWAIIYQDDQRIDGINVNTHLTNGILSIIDLFISGTPVRFLHLIYLPAYGVVYTAFTGIYYAANGTNPFDGERYIYDVLDYGNSPGTAAGIAVAIVLVVAPIFHLIFYGLYWLRVGCNRLYQHYCYNITTNDDEQEEIEDKVHGKQSIASVDIVMEATS